MTARFADGSYRPEPLDYRPPGVNGHIHLNVIKAAANPAAESWRNINTIDDLVEAILTTTGKLTAAAIAGNAAAGA